MINKLIILIMPMNMLQGEEGDDETEEQMNLSFS